MNVQKEEKAQQEVSRLQQEFHKVHNDKNEKITALSLGPFSVETVFTVCICLPIFRRSRILDF